MKDAAVREIINKFIAENELPAIDKVIETLPSDLATAVKNRAVSIKEGYAAYVRLSYEAKAHAANMMALRALKHEDLNGDNNEAAWEHINKLVAWVNWPLTRAEEDWPKNTPQAKINETLDYLERGIKDLPPWLAAAVANQALISNGGLEEFYRKHQNDELSAQAGDRYDGNPSVNITSFNKIAAHIAGTPKGDAAVSRLVALAGWPKSGDGYIGRAIGEDADLAYGIEAARQIKAKGGDPSSVYKIINEGITKFKNNTLSKINADIKKYNAYSHELTSLIQNDGAVMTPEQLDKAIKGYYKDHPGYEAKAAELRQHIWDDCAKLIRDTHKFNNVPSECRASVEQALNAITGDPAASLAISMAFKNDPKFTKSPLFEAAVEFTTSPYFVAKEVDIGRKLSDELATAVIQNTLTAKLGRLDLFNPASSTIAGKAIIDASKTIAELRSNAYLKCLGVQEEALNEADAALKKLADKVTKKIAAVNVNDINTLNAIRAVSLNGLNEFENEIKEFDDALGKIKGFANGTAAGNCFRLAGAILAAVGFYGKLRNATDSPDALNIAKALSSSASFAARTSALAHSLDLVEGASVIGKLGGTGKLFGLTVAKMTEGATAVFDAIDCGLLLAKGDNMGAAFAATRAVGGGLTLVEAGSWTGPVGLALVFAGVMAPELVHNVKEAEKYGKASRRFLIAGGYSPAAAKTIIWHQRISYETGKKAPQMLLLARYAKHKKMTIPQFQDWINNRLSNQQLERVLSAVNWFDRYGAGTAKLTEMIESASFDPTGNPTMTSPM